MDYEWINEWTNERASEWVRECVSEWVREWVREWVCERVSEWLSEWASERVIEWVSDWVTDKDYEWACECVSRWVRERVGAWAGGCVSGWARELVSGWVSDWESGRANEWLKGWMRSVIADFFRLMLRPNLEKFMDHFRVLAICSAWPSQLAKKAFPPFFALRIAPMLFNIFGVVAFTSSYSLAWRRSEGRPEWDRMVTPYILMNFRGIISTFSQSRHDFSRFKSENDDDNEQSNGLE